MRLYWSKGYNHDHILETENGQKVGQIRKYKGQYYPRAVCVEAGQQWVTPPAPFNRLDLASVWVERNVPKIGEPVEIEIIKI